MAEWLKAHAWKACIEETLSRVRIPLSPPVIKIARISAQLIAMGVHCAVRMLKFGKRRFEPTSATRRPFQPARARLQKAQGQNRQKCSPDKRPWGHWSFGSHRDNRCCRFYRQSHD